MSLHFEEIGGKIFETVKEKSPEILIGVGIVAIGAGIFLACKATLKIDREKAEIEAEINEAVESAKDKMEEIDEGVESDTLSYDEQDAAQDKAIVYGRTAKSVMASSWRVVKAYAPAAGCIVLGFVCIIFSHKIMQDRETTLLAAYTALDSAFKIYRARVVEEGGKEMDARFLYGTKTEMKEVKRVNPETGLEETVIETEEVPDYPLGSPYARIYDKAHSACYQDADPNNAWNETYLKQLQEQANQLLNRRGYVFLNEVYDMLCLTKTPEGQYVGWIKDNPDGDGYIDFGITLAYEDPRFKDFIEKKKLRRKLVLDFNVDGVIIDKIVWGLKGKNDLSEDELDEIEDLRSRAARAYAGLEDPVVCEKYQELENDRYARMNR